MEKNKTHTEKWFKPIVEFTTHVVLAIVMFTVIAASAFLLHVLVHLIESHLEAGLVSVLRWLTFLVFGLDIFLFVLYLFKEVKNFLKEILK